MKLDSLLDLVYPRFCLSCGRGLLDSPWTWLCPACLARIEPLGPSPCPVCAGELGPGSPVSSCPSCRRLAPRFAGATAVGRYQGVLRELVTRMKYGRDASIALPLGELLAQHLARWERTPDVDRVVPVPSTPLRRLARGFNQAELIAAEAARRLDLPLSTTVLFRRRAGPPQASLPRSERLLAPRGTVRARDASVALAPALERLPPRIGCAARSLLRSPVRGRTVLLVDDVLTTGATASESARALLRLGAEEVLVAAVARA